jgi:C-terminal processing protease CtpA/Prc
MTPALVLDAETCRAIVEAALTRLAACYVFADRAMAIEQALRHQLAQGAYDTITDGSELQATLTTHMRAVQDDRHLRLVYYDQAQPPRDNAYTDPEWLANYWREAAIDNYGVYAVERLAGNVGYLDLRSIDEAEYTAPTLAAAMALLTHTSALLIDLRANSGGASSGVSFFCSYLHGQEPVHLNDIYSRPDNRTQQFWSSAYVPGQRYLSKPVYVLTSANTFSGGEEIAYNLQALKRALVVGERTLGGAHPVEVYQLHPHFDLRVPTARAINPITGTNWEGVCVLPDIDAEGEEALNTAYAHALASIIEQLEREQSEEHRKLLEEARAAQQMISSR